jgi:hypothetical protein
MLARKRDEPVSAPGVSVMWESLGGSKGEAGRAARHGSIAGRRPRCASRVDRGAPAALRVTGRSPAALRASRHGSIAGRRP